MHRTEGPRPRNSTKTVYETVRSEAGPVRKEFNSRMMMRDQPLTHHIQLSSPGHYVHGHLHQNDHHHDEPSGKDMVDILPVQPSSETKAEIPAHDKKDEEGFVAHLLNRSHLNKPGYDYDHLSSLMWNMKMRGDMGYWLTLYLGYKRSVYKLDMKKLHEQGALGIRSIESAKKFVLFYLGNVCAKKHGPLPAMKDCLFLNLSNTAYSALEPFTRLYPEQYICVLYNPAEDEKI